jgi:hypothetical protein
MGEITSCPTCIGKKGHRAIARVDGGACVTEWRACSTCKGAGIVTPELAARIEKGERMRLDRIRRGASQADEAKRLGITTQELADREWGRTCS